MDTITEIYKWFNHPLMLIVLVVVNLPVYRFLSEIIFGRNGGLRESIGYWFTPDIVSMFRGEWTDDRWAEIKLGFYVVACILTVAAEYTGISKLLALLGV